MNVLSVSSETSRQQLSNGVIMSSMLALSQSHQEEPVSSSCESNESHQNPITFFLASRPESPSSSKGAHRNDDDLIWYTCDFCDFQYPDLLGLVDHEQRHARNKRAEKYFQFSTKYMASPNIHFSTDTIKNVHKDGENNFTQKGGIISNELLQAELDQATDWSAKNLHLPKMSYHNLEHSSMTRRIKEAPHDTVGDDELTLSMDYFTKLMSPINKLLWKTEPNLNENHKINLPVNQFNKNPFTNQNFIEAIKKPDANGLDSLDPETSRYFIVTSLNGRIHLACRICNKSFLIASRARRHKLLHTGERLFTCPTCNNKSYIYSHGLDRHLKKFHKILK